VSVVTTGGDIFIKSERSLPAVDADNSSINKPSPNMGINVKIVVTNTIGRIVNKIKITSLIDFIII
jgi:hypothetical protein